MTDEEISAAVRNAREEIAAATAYLEDAQHKLEMIRKRCPHRQRDSWTNNDGDGQFRVEKCKACGLQKDGGLGGLRS